MGSQRSRRPNHVVNRNRMITRFPICVIVWAFLQGHRRTAWEQMTIPYLVARNISSWGIRGVLSLRESMAVLGECGGNSAAVGTPMHPAGTAELARPVESREDDLPPSAPSRLHVKCYESAWSRWSFADGDFRPTFGVFLTSYGSLVMEVDTMPRCVPKWSSLRLWAGEQGD